MERLYPIRYDTIYGGKQPKMEFMQNDTEASKIAFELYEGNIAMTGIYDVSFTVERFDGNTYTYGSSNAVIEDNFITITLPPSAVYTAGKCYITMSVYNDTLGRVTFGKFVYTVKEELVADQPIDSSEYYPVLIDLINKNSEYSTNYDEVLALSAESATLELVDARKGEANLGVKIGKIDLSIADNINGTVTETSTIITNERKYSNDKSTILNTSVVALDVNSEIENVTVNTSSAEGVVFTNDTSGHTISKTNLNSADIGVHLNLANVKRTKIKESNIDVTGSFAVLVNQNSQGGSNLSIIDNTISSDIGDGVEINTPNEGTNTFRGIRVIGNHIECGTGGETPSAGFAIGIAQGQDVVVVGNVVEGSRQEQLHIEDCSENVAVIGNVFNNCNADGCKVLNRYRLPGVYAKIPIISGNHFKALTNKKTHKGLYRVYDANLIVDGMNFTNNRLEGFDTALHFEGGGIVNVDGCVIENCNKAIAVSGKVKGSVITSNTPTLLSFASNGSVEDITSLTPISLNSLFTHTLDANSIGQINKFKFPLEDYTSLANATNNIGLFKTPKYMKGTITARTGLKGSTTFVQSIGEIEITGGVLTFTSKFSNSYGAYGSPTFALSSGYVCYQYYNATASQIMATTVEFNGILIIDSTT